MFWVLGGVLYIVLFITLALMTLRKGHLVLFWVGIIFPVLWLIGAIMPPTSRAAARAAA